MQVIERVPQLGTRSFFCFYWMGMQILDHICRPNWYYCTSAPQPLQGAVRSRLRANDQIAKSHFSSHGCDDHKGLCQKSRQLHQVIEGTLGTGIIDQAATPSHPRRHVCTPSPATSVNAQRGSLQHSIILERREGIPGTLDITSDTSKANIKIKAILLPLALSDCQYRPIALPSNPREPLRNTRRVMTAMSV